MVSEEEGRLDRGPGHRSRKWMFLDRFVSRTDRICWRMGVG